ncbi:glycosyltransferase family 9 protein [Granulibacter bethesdensis]|uniref:ADP-heptose--LPS heptosyltransferase n=2 Tax=Granulibacter bethesdensis TaxID=364410 RepID=A0AAN0RFD0_9PROT|nr:glycosyltransferase family 9 protein [Granulibacter bethesdensis]AHJ63872.1 ADP-heptose--LPS heptosyltransferase [Granulibacter bethesdensis]AHJ65547.1 ADP-heptose--LPS heptosyltransferase [Granulibacter bethesdensis CGDNIH4]APH52751.1 ADP-heptose--LPS heptosyltransferase [Granulibacter bethesdensis]
MRILFVTATRIGDAVLSTALLDYLGRAFPEARFTIACGPAAEGVFLRMPRRDATIIVEKRPRNGHWFALWRQVAPRWWDMVVDLRGSALSLTIPARRRFIMRGGRRPGHRLIHLAGALGIRTPIAPVVWFGPEDEARAATLIPEGSPVLALGPTANWDGKLWPAERFVALAGRMRAGQPALRIAVLAGPGEKERALAHPVLAAIPGAIDLAGAVSLPEAAACLSRCALFVGNDSGLMHLSAASGIPTLGLFGPTPAAEYAPAGRHAAAVMADGPPGEAPMEALTVDKVVTAAEELLRQPGWLRPGMAGVVMRESA